LYANVTVPLIADCTVV